MSKKYQLLINFFFVLFLLNIIITPNTAQAGKDQIKIFLDQKTIKRGYPVASLDQHFKILVLPNIFDAPVSVELNNINLNSSLLYSGFSYQFRITQNNQVPLVVKPLVAIANVADFQKKYARMYIFHNSSQVWLALSSYFDRERDLVISKAIDFAEAKIGVFFADTPLPNRITERKTAESELIQTVGNKAKLDNLVIKLGDDIIEKGYTVNFNNAALAFNPGVLNQPAELFLNWDDQSQILDFNLISYNQHQDKVLSSGKSIVLKFSQTTNQNQKKKVVFWDNNFKSWRDLPSEYNYDDNTVLAKTPFWFGKYKIKAVPGVFVGKASWYPDRLISQTKFSAACNDYPNNTLVLVTNLNTGKQVKVRVLSTGPFVAGRIIDLSYSAFSQLANPKQGILEVKIEKISL